VTVERLLIEKNLTPLADGQPVVTKLESQPKIDTTVISTPTTLNQTSGKFKFNVVTDNMIDSLNSIIPPNAASAAMSLETFHLMIAAAVNNHPEMRAVVEQTKVAGFVSSEAFSAYLPQITASVDAGTRTSRSSTSSDILPNGDGIDAAMSVKQLLYDFGATGASYDSAKYKEQASLERMATKRSELSFRAISAYIELLRARLQYRLSQENYNSRLSILNMVKERYELGGGNKVDVIRAEARLTDASSIKISAAISLQLAEAGYREMFLQDPDETPMLQDVSIELANQSIDELSKRYGAVRETELGLKSLRSDAKAAESRMLPTLNFEVNGARRSQETYYGDYSETSAHLVMRYNLFTGGADSARKQQAVHRAEQMQQDLDNLILQVKKSIMQSTTQVNEAESLVRVRREGVLGASQSLLAVKEHFSYRRGTLLDLLRSQEELYTASRDYISSLMDRSIARYRLLHLTAALETMIPDLKSQ
jgi:adhesin transport system outer membrane protein